MAGNIDLVKDRLIKFLLKDKIGIRKSLLKLFSEKKNCNTVEIYDYLIKQGFNVNYRVSLLWLDRCIVDLGFYGYI